MTINPGKKRPSGEPGNSQLTLPLSHTEHSLRQYLEEAVGTPASLIITNNSTSMLSVRTRDNVMQIRLHRIFLRAGIEVIEEMVSFLKGKRGKMQLFHKFVRQNRQQLADKPPKKFLPKMAGKFHDLCALYDEINEHYFEGAVNAAITWGAGSPRSAVRKRTLGSYSERSNLIRINPVLDRKTVPRYYVSFVVYHEMLHAAIGISEEGGRRSVHSKEFRRREKMFRDHEKAVAWERRKA